jgi:hypothetical protein
MAGGGGGADGGYVSSSQPYATLLLELGAAEPDRQEMCMTDIDPVAAAELAEALAHQERAEALLGDADPDTVAEANARVNVAKAAVREAHKRA